MKFSVKMIIVFALKAKETFGQPNILDGVVFTENFYVGVLIPVPQIVILFRERDFKKR